MSSHCLTDEKIPHYMTSNLSKVYFPQQANKNLRKRLLHLRNYLDADGLIKWAQETPPRSWCKGSFENFTDNVDRFQNRTYSWPVNVVNYLRKLSRTDLKDSQDFEAHLKRMVYVLVVTRRKYANNLQDIDDQIDPREAGGSRPLYADINTKKAQQDQSEAQAPSAPTTQEDDLIGEVVTTSGLQGNWPR